jgi:hypothetical protein
MHWLGPYIIKYVIEASVVQLETLNGEVLGGMVNGNRPKNYRDNQPPVH